MRIRMLLMPVTAALMLAVAAIPAALTMTAGSETAFAAERNMIYTATKKGSYNTLFGPMLQTELAGAEILKDLQTTAGSIDNLERVLADPTSIGFSQWDAYVQFLEENDDVDDEVIGMYGNLAPECVFVVVRTGGPIGSYSDLTRDDEPVRVAIDKKKSGTEATFKYMMTLDPRLEHADTVNRGGLRALSKVASGAYDAALFVTFPNPDTKFIKTVMKNDSLEFLPLVDRRLVGRLPGRDEAVYTFSEVTVEEGGYFSSGKTVMTICTSLGVIANEDGDGDMLDALADAVMGGRLTPEEKDASSWMTKMTKKAIAEAEKMAQGASKFVQEVQQQLN